MLQVLPPLSSTGAKRRAGELGVCVIRNAKAAAGLAHYRCERTRTAAQKRIADGQLKK